VTFKKLRNLNHLKRRLWSAEGNKVKCGNVGEIDGKAIPNHFHHNPSPLKKKRINTCPKGLSK
jgi:hypothetical protein